MRMLYMCYTKMAGTAVYKAEVLFDTGEVDGQLLIPV
jgi:hypothetical protein